MFQHPEILRGQLDEYRRDRITEADRARLLAAARHYRRRHPARHTRAAQAAGTVVPCGQHGAVPAR